MQYIKRIFFFLLTNIAVLALLSVVMSIVNLYFPNLIQANGWIGRLLIYALVLGFGGSFISLWISRWSAKKAYNIILIDSQSASSNIKLQSVWQTVERIAQAHNITMPEVGYYESAEPNAFATGSSKNRSLVAVSSGLLEQMEKNEIEGVVGHEMAHILNGDMVTLTLIQGVLNTFVIVLTHLATRAVVAALARNDNDGETIGYFAHFGISMIFQIIFWLLASVVIMWFSRIREYRADLGGAQFTSKSHMIAGLKRLQKMTAVDTHHTDTKMTAFMINEPDGWFSTHPSLTNRIKALEENYQLA